MRYAALLLFIGCSAGPSVDVPPPVVVEPVSDAYKLPDAEGDSKTSRLQAPDAAENVENNGDNSVRNSCDCGDECRCVDCQCADCPHRGVKESLTTRELTVIGAEWCGPCRVIHDEHGDTPGVRFVDIDRDRAEAIRLWGAMPARIPAFVLTIDGEPVQRWSASSHKPWIEGMRDFEVSGDRQPTHDAQPHDAAKAGDSPAHVQVNAGRGTATGVCVGTQDGRSLVLTNHHVCYVGGQPAGVPSVYLDGRWIPGELIASDNDADLALFSVPANLRPVAIADAQPVAGSQVRTYGYGGGRHTPRVTVTLAGYPGGGQMVGCCLTRFAFVPGESGSAVMHGDRLVGLVTGRDPSGRFGVVVDLPSIRVFLSRWGVL